MRAAVVGAGGEGGGGAGGDGGDGGVSGGGTGGGDAGGGVTGGEVVIGGFCVQASSVNNSIKPTTAPRLELAMLIGKIGMSRMLELSNERWC